MSSSKAWYYDLQSREYFLDESTRVAPFKRDNGHDAVRAHFFTCGQCSEEERFLGFYEKYCDEVKEQIERDGRSQPPLHERTFQGRLYSTDGVTWVAAHEAEGLAICRRVQERCPHRKLRYCVP
jgi:hypothetical protein